MLMVGIPITAAEGPEPPEPSRDTAPEAGEEAFGLDMDRPSEDVRVGGALELVVEKSVRVLVVESAVALLRGLCFLLIPLLPSG
jgi:hypothetical protein